MQNAGLDEAQALIKIAGRNINNLRYADDTILMAESEEELESLSVKVKEENGKAGLKLNTQKMKIMVSGPITSWQIDGETIETLQARREWQDILKVMKDNNLQPRILYPARISFKYEGEIKSFTDKQKLREFSTTKPALQQMLKDLL